MAKSPRLKKTNIATVSGVNNAGESITNAVTDIPFIEVLDSHNAWNGSAYTVQNDESIVSIKAHTLFTSSVNRNIALYVNGVFYRRITDGDGDALSNDGLSYIGYLGEFVAGDVLSLRTEASGGTLGNSTIYHYININEKWESLG